VEISKLRNDVGRTFARECLVEELWGEDGPSAELVRMVYRQAPSELSDEQCVLMRVALTVYEGSGGMPPERARELLPDGSLLRDFFEVFMLCAGEAVNLEAWVSGINSVPVSTAVN
jgi:hypothetical protein